MIPVQRNTRGVPFFRPPIAVENDPPLPDVDDVRDMLLGSVIEDPDDSIIEDLFLMGANNMQYSLMFLEPVDGDRIRYRQSLTRHRSWFTFQTITSSTRDDAIHWDLADDRMAHCMSPWECGYSHHEDRFICLCDAMKRSCFSCRNVIGWIDECSLPFTTFIDAFRPCKLLHSVLQPVDIFV